MSGSPVPSTLFWPLRSMGGPPFRLLSPPCWGPATRSAARVAARQLRDRHLARFWIIRPLEERTQAPPVAAAVVFIVGIIITIAVSIFTNIIIMFSTSMHHRIIPSVDI